MDKLLHERMREFNEHLGCQLQKFMGVSCKNMPNCTICVERTFGMVADEIERDYIPRTEHDAAIRAVTEAQEGPSKGGYSAHHIMKLWAEKNGMTFEEKQTVTEWLDKWFIKRPLFDDGEPVQFGDEIKHSDTGETCIVTSIHVFDDGCYCFSLKGPHASSHYMADKFVKRPTPKVLDADGVEIHVGDTVWNIYNGCEHEVIGLPEVDCYQSVEIRNVKTGSKGGIDTNLLTHKKPVFDADGVRICVGDTVWHTIEGARGIVKHIAKGSDFNVLVEFEDGDEGNNSPRYLTHKEPDSQERIDEDASLDPRCYYNEHIGHDVGLKDDSEVIEAVIKHLLRRQRDLMERGA